MSAACDREGEKAGDMSHAPHTELDPEEIVYPDYIKIPPTSPFSEAWGQYRLDVENCRWHKATKGNVKGRWVRALWGSELYQERRSDTTGRYVFGYSR